ncbi:hypothetical protein [Streptomyces sennicomposti]|uniref:hypothetical protein n=1 Tax=Streptomyces sennicomposti TaxID=2873384 RepID=UPI001CA5F733|nr:hypothetical protein [Streptomyces sennicomposti]MBY8868690.1 hypothetical protein [Streptomyces sennicomposti]
MGSDFYTDAFAADIARLRDPAWAEPGPEHTAKVCTRLDALADELADQLSTRVRDLPAAAPEDAHLVVRDAGDWHLARLRALREIRTVAEQLADRTVAAAGTRGAGYPQLGDAWAITRQGARKKWPHAVSAMSEPPSGQEPRTTINAFGGTADVSWHGAEGGWWWIGQGADGTPGDAGEDTTYDTKEEAAAMAGAFLQQHATQTTNGDPQ